MGNTVRVRLSRRVTMAAFTVAVAMLAAACGSGGKVDSPTPLVSVSAPSHLTIGVDEDQPGLGLRDGNTYSGFDIDTATYVAGALGVKKSAITWVEATPGNRQKLLETGRVDLVVSTYSITPQRQKVVDFAGPYFIAHQSLLVRRNDTEITGPKTLDGKVLCSVAGTTSAAYVKQHYRGTITLKEYPRFSACVKALAAGNVDAVTTDDVILAGYASSPQYKGKLKLVGPGFTNERYGIGIKKGDTAMVDAVNAALKQYISSGAWKQALDTTVGPSGYSIPSPPTPGSD